MLNIRLATADDIDNVYSLSNDSTVRAFSFNESKIPYDSHVVWYKEKIASRDSLFYVIEFDSNFAGYCRLDKDNYDWVITIHILEKFRSQKLGSRALNEVCAINSEKRLIAYVKKNNINSACFFKSNGFIPLGEFFVKGVKCLKFKKRTGKNVIAICNDLYKSTGVYSKKNVIYINSKDKLSLKNLLEINPDYVFFPHWSYIIPHEIFDNFNCVIFHMTDLPFGRGGSPLQNLIERGIYKTKISALRCVEELDAGEIFLKKDFDISYGSASEIYKKAGDLISVMIDEIIEKNPLPTCQEGEVTCFNRRKKSQSDIKDLRCTKKIYDYIRMLDAPGYPRAFLESNGIIYEFYGARFDNGTVVANVEIRNKNE